jgi:cob(I)alamin adenosyltransferase
VLAVAQVDCFRLGALLAAAPGADPGVEPPADEEITAFEQAIDALEAQLPALKHFVLPGGCEGAARLHMARTICRRAERAVVALAAVSDVPSSAVRWLNRLSDLLFVQARFANQEAGVPDVAWVPRPRK